MSEYVGCKVNKKLEKLVKQVNPSKGSQPSAEEDFSTYRADVVVCHQIIQNNPTKWGKG